MATLRPDEVTDNHPATGLLADLAARERVTVIELPPLDAAETQELAAQVTGRILSAEEGAALYAATEGNPLFVVEMLRAGCTGLCARACGAAAESGGAAGRAMPARVQAVLARRLARLSPLAHELAGVAAVIGRAFHFPLLAAVCTDRDADTLLGGLEELVQRRIICECPDGVYAFSHTRLREAAADQLSAARRQVLHCRVAAALAARQDAAHSAQAG